MRAQTGKSVPGWLTACARLGAIPPPAKPHLPATLVPSAAGTRLAPSALGVRLLLPVRAPTTRRWRQGAARRGRSPVCTLQADWTQLNDPAKIGGTACSSVAVQVSARRACRRQAGWRAHGRWARLKKQGRGLAFF